MGVLRAGDRVAPRAQAHTAATLSQVHPTPHTLHPTSYTQHPTPYTLNSNPSTPTHPTSWVWTLEPRVFEVGVWCEYG